MFINFVDKKIYIQLFSLENILQKRDCYFEVFKQESVLWTLIKK